MNCHGTCERCQAEKAAALEAESKRLEDPKRLEREEQAMRRRELEQKQRSRVQARERFHRSPPPRRAEHRGPRGR